MSCFVLLRPHMPEIMAELILQLDPEPKVEFISASNNAAWSVGEVALRYGRDDTEFRNWVTPLIARLIPILLHPKSPRSLHENAAVSIGRIGLMHPGLVAPHLQEFAQAWCQALHEIRDNEEKDSAFRGFCTLVQTNPAGVAKVRRCRFVFSFFACSCELIIWSRACCGSAMRSCGGINRRRS